LVVLLASAGAVEFVVKGSPLGRANATVVMSTTATKWLHKSLPE
jgi:hypothetical protein